MLIVQSVLDRTRDERAASAHADSPVQRSDEIIVEGYVHSHGHTMTHGARLLPYSWYVQR